MKNDAFSVKHPSVIFAYFVAVITLCAIIRHPVCTVISFVSAVLYSLILDAKRTGKLLVTFCLPVFILTAAINPLFNHRGTIVLAYFPSGNALTLESIVYGLFSALMLAALLVWFSVFSKIFTSDKIVWLIGRVFPIFALLISMTLHLIPELIRRFKAVKSAQIALKGNDGKHNRTDTVKSAFSRFSSVVTWTLESSISTSDSMKSRGYGLPGRSSYSPFIFTRSDIYALFAVLSLFLITLTGYMTDAFSWHYYPSMGGTLLDVRSLIFDLCFMALCLVPLVIDGKEALKCHFLRSGI